MAEQVPNITVWRDDGPGLSRVMFCANDPGNAAPVITEIWHEFSHAPSRLGSVHWARVTRIFEPQNRMLVSLADDTIVNCRIAKGRVPAPVGGMVLITITAPPREAKPHQAMVGARLVSSLFVLLPGQSGVQQSRALEPVATDDVVAAVTAIIAAAPFECGVILRRGSAGMSAAVLTVQLEAMIAEWQTHVAPDALTSANPKLGCVFDGGTLDRRITRHVSLADIRATGSDDGVDDAVFDAAYDAAMAVVTTPAVPLPSGGTLWIEPTRALCAIDLDSGSGSITSLAAEAPAAIAHHWRLRGLGGLMAVDVPRLPPAAAQKFSADLARACASDPRHPDILGRSRGGILECRIPHGAVPLQALMASEEFPMMLALARTLRMIARRPMLVAPQIVISPRMAELLQGPLAPALASLDRDVSLVVSSDQQQPEVME